MKLNFLPPHMRERQRYIVFEILSKKEFDLIDISNTIWNNALQILGEAGIGESSLWVLSDSYDKSKKKGVVKCNHKSVEKIRVVLASIRQINEEPVIIHILGVTGTIKGAKVKFLGITDLRDFKE